MPNIFSSNENLGSLPPLIGVEILDMINRSSQCQMSLFDIFDRVKGRSWFTPRNVYYALTFLFLTELIEFDGVYVSAVKNAAN